MPKIPTTFFLLNACLTNFFFFFFGLFFVCLFFFVFLLYFYLSIKNFTSNSYKQLFFYKINTQNRKEIYKSLKYFLVFQNRPLYSYRLLRKITSLDTYDLSLLDFNRKGFQYNEYRLNYHFLYPVPRNSRNVGFISKNI